MKRVIILLLVALTAWKLFTEPGSVELGPGVLAADIPRQTAIKSPRTFEHDGFSITPLAEFQIKAKVLSRERYSFDRWADLSPLDLALGWGRMSDESVLEHINISQSGRWYRWNTKTLPIPFREIQTHSANMHMIPSSDDVEDELESARTGDIISLKGQLVKVTDNEGWRWKSSLTREDSGDGACEIIWVESFEVIPH